MKNILFTILLTLAATLPMLSQESVDVAERTVRSDYIVKETVMGTTRIIEDSITGLKVTHITVFKETRYTNYILLDSVFRYDSLLPNDIDEYSISDIWGDYVVDYGYDDSYDDYDDGYDDYDYDEYSDDSDDYGDDGYYEDNEYDEGLEDDYRVDDENGESTENNENNETQDSTLVEEDYEDLEDYQVDSSYVFLSYDLEYLSNGEIIENFAEYIPDVLSVFDNIKGHKLHKISILDTISVVERDTISSFQLEALTWERLRKEETSGGLPLKPFIEKKLAKFGKNDAKYVIEMDKPKSYKKIKDIITTTKPDFDIDQKAWQKLDSLGIDPNEYLADIVWISYLLPYYSSNIEDQYLRQIFVTELKKKRSEKISKFKAMCSYDFNAERSFKNIIQDTTMLKNPRFERTIDPDKKVPIIQDNSQLAFSVTEELNEEIGRYDRVHAGVISTTYELEEVTIADPQTGQPTTFKRIKLQPDPNFVKSKYNKVPKMVPILLETASFGVTFTHLNVEALTTTTRNMKYAISKLTRNNKLKETLREYYKLNRKGE